MANLSTFNSVLKTQYVGPVRDQIYSNHILLNGSRWRDDTSKLEDPQGSRPFKGIRPLAEGVTYTGKGWIMPLHYGGNAGVGFRAEDAALPGHGSQSYTEITGTLRYLYARVRWTGPVIKLSDSNMGAFLRAVSSEIKKTVTDTKRVLVTDAWTSRDANGTSPLATVTTGANNATQAVSTTVYFRVGDYVEVIDPTGATYRNATVSLMITAVNGPAKTITLSAAVTSTTGDYIIRAAPNSVSAARNNDLGNSTNGLMNIVAATGVLHGLNPATAGMGFWASYVKDNSAGAISDTVLRDAVDNIGLSSGYDGDLVGLWTRGIRNAYAATLTSLKRFNDADSVTLRGGFKALMFDETPMVVDDYCPQGNVIFINPEDLFWADCTDFDWMDKDGEVLNRVPDRDAYEATLYKYYDLGATRRNTHARIFNVADAIVR